MKAEDYIKKAADNKKLASEMLDNEITKADSHFDKLIKSAKPEDQGKAMQAVSKAKGILQQVKQGGDIHDLVKQLQNLNV